MSPSTDMIILSLYNEIDRLEKENIKLNDRLAKAQAVLTNSGIRITGNTYRNWEYQYTRLRNELEKALGELSTKGEFKAYLRCKEPSEQCGKCEFLKQCKELNPQSEFTKGEVKE